MGTQRTRRSGGVLGAMACCMALQMTSLVMVLPLFARRFEGLGAGVEALSASAMAYALTSTLAAPAVGALADRVGRRPVVLVSFAAQILAFGGYLTAASAWQIIWLRGLAGVLTGGLVPAITSIVGDLAPEMRRAQWIGIVNGGASVGWIAGPLLGGLLYDRFGYVVPFAASMAMATAALLLAALLIPETYGPGARRSLSRPAWRHGLQALPARPTVLLLMLIALGVMFAWAFIEPQFMFYAYDDLRWTSSQLGLVMSAYGVAFMSGELGLGRLSDRLGRKPVLVLGLALFSAQFVGLALFREPICIVAGFVVAGLGNALYDPALGAFLLDITPPEQSAGMIGLRGMAGSFGGLLGPALVVLVTPVAGPRVVFLMAAALVAVLTLTSWLVLRTPEGGVARRLLEAASVRPEETPT